MNRVFVYGTLLHGESNHGLLAKATFVRRARTTPDYHLVDLGEFPALVAGGSVAVLGEVYDVNDDDLVSLDELEDHPNFYQRGRVTLEDGEEVMAYLLGPDYMTGFSVISNGSWLYR
ncbi:MAG: gamma-glutamylcyclotransferase family protein [Oceanococcus sp.]